MFAVVLAYLFTDTLYFNYDASSAFITDHAKTAVAGFLRR